MVNCNLLGFSGYVFVLVFFLVGLLVSYIITFKHFQYGMKNGWFEKYKVKESSTPLGNFFFFLFLSLLGTYLVVYKLAFIILPNYWNCLYGM